MRFPLLTGLTNCAKCLVAGCALALLAGCATEVSQHTFLGQPRTPAAANAKVDIYTNGLPSRAFDRIAVLDVHCESQGFATPGLDKAIPQFVKQAREAGCDGVIEIQEAPVPQNWTLETRVKHFTGVGIAYK